MTDGLLDTEHQAAVDARLTAAIEAHACTAEHGGLLCGAPLDDDGFCEVHQ